MLVEQLDEAPVGTTFFCYWNCTEDTLLTSEVGVVAGGVASGLATGALGLSRSEDCGKDLLVLDLKFYCCHCPYTSLSALRARWYNFLTLAHSL
jgi:hypothetical protein